MANVTRDIGPVSAYALAVKHGYKGTEEEWARLQMEAGANAQRAENAASVSEASAQLATAQAADAASSRAAAETSAMNAAESFASAKSSADMAAGSAEAAKESADGAEAARAAAEASANAADASAARAEEAAQKLESASQIDDSIASFERVWSSRRTVERLCPAFEKSGSVVSCYPVEGYPLGVKSQIRAVQEGSGDPSPENVRPISGWNAAAVTRCGKNLVPVNNISVVGAPTAAQQRLKGDFYGTYTLSAVITKYPDDTATNTRMGVNIYYTDGTLDSFRGEIATGDAERDGAARYKTLTFTIGAERQVERMDVRVLDYTAASEYRNAKAENIQLEAGAAATPFEPYRGDAYTVQFGETVYGGEYDWETGVLTVDCIKYSVTGAEKWQMTGARWQSDTKVSAWMNAPTSAQDGLTEPAKSKIKSDRLVWGSWEWSNATSDNTVLARLNNIYIALSNTATGAASTDTDEIKLSKLKAYLAAQHAAGTPVTVAYSVTEPYTIRLDPQAIPALSGPNNLWSDTGETAVSGRTDPVRVMETMQERLAALENAVINNI